MDTDPVTIARFDTVVEAESVRGILADAGIAAHLTDTHLVTADPLSGIALGRIRLQVEPARAAEAARIVEAHERGVQEAREAREIDPEGSENACIACGAPFPEYLERCPACGLSYS
jgi:hypothetical protein